MPWHLQSALLRRPERALRQESATVKCSRNRGKAPTGSITRIKKMISCVQHALIENYSVPRILVNSKTSCLHGAYHLTTGTDVSRDASVKGQMTVQGAWGHTGGGAG